MSEQPSAKELRESMIELMEKYYSAEHSAKIKAGIAAKKQRQTMMESNNDGINTKNIKENK